MFGFDMVLAGVRGLLPGHAPAPADVELDDRALEEFGVDWEALNDDDVIASNLRNNPRNEGTGSWIGRQGPPPHLNEVPVEAPQAPLSEHACGLLLGHVAEHMNQFDRESLVARWTAGLAFASQLDDRF